MKNKYPKPFSRDSIEASATQPGQWILLYECSEVTLYAGKTSKRFKVSRRDWEAIRRVIWKLNTL